MWVRSSHPDVFLVKGVSKICSKFTGEHPYQSVMISIKLPSNFIEITLRHGCFLVNLLHIFRTPFKKNASGCLILVNEDNKKKDQYSNILRFKMKALFVSYFSIGRDVYQFTRKYEKEIIWIKHILTFSLTLNIGLSITRASRAKLSY